MRDYGGPHGSNNPYGAFRPKPVSVGDELDVTIDDVSRRGDGLVRVKGYVVFVPNTKKGDSVKIRIVKVRPSFAVAEVVSGPG